MVYLMVVEFSNRLRKELIKLQNSTSELRGRAGTSDTGIILWTASDQWNMGLLKKISLRLFVQFDFFHSFFEI